MPGHPLHATPRGRHLDDGISVHLTSTCEKTPPPKTQPAYPARRGRGGPRSAGPHRWRTHGLPLTFFNTPRPARLRSTPRLGLPPALPPVRGPTPSPSPHPAADYHALSFPFRFVSFRRVRDATPDGCSSACRVTLSLNNPQPRTPAPPRPRPDRLPANKQGGQPCSASQCCSRCRHHRCRGGGLLPIARPVIESL